MLKNYIKLSIIASLAISSASAYEMKPVGFKATGMGGTGVANTRGSLSGYYNPALLKFSDYTTEVSINVGVRIRESNLMENMDTLSNIDFQTTVDNIADNVLIGNKEGTALSRSLYVPGTDNKDTDKQNIITAQETLKKISSNNAFQVSATPSFTAQFSDSFAIGYYKNVDIGFNLNINPNYTDLIFKDTNNNQYYEYIANDPSHTGHDVYKLYIDQAEGKKAYETTSLEYASKNDINNITLTAEDLDEIPLSYAKMFDLKQGSLSVGGSIKALSLTTTSKVISLGESSSNADDDLENSQTTYKSNIGLDLGLAFRPTDSKITFGLVGKNINSPKFKVDDSKNGVTDSYTIDSSYRAGVSLPVWNDNMEFALDVDLSKNDTLIEGEKSQMLGTGVELHPSSWFSLRMGAMKDLASEKYDDGVIMTGGLGFGLKWFQIDLSAMVSSEKGQYDGESIPRYMQVNFSLVSKWGSGYNK